MKTINFRPLRVIKKTGKITVASYTEWNKVRCANYSGFYLNLINEYKDFDKNEFVYNHKGDLLYHFNYNPWDVFIYHGSFLGEGFSWEELRNNHKNFKIINKDFEGEDWSSYFLRGADCNGTPTFSHWDYKRVTENGAYDYYGIESFEPITVEYVLNWLGWFLYELENSKLKII